MADIWRGALIVAIAAPLAFCAMSFMAKQSGAPSQARSSDLVLFHGGDSTLPPTIAANELEVCRAVYRQALDRAPGAFDEFRHPFTQAARANRTASNRYICTVGAGGDRLAFLVFDEVCEPATSAACAPLRAVVTRRDHIAYVDARDPTAQMTADNLEALVARTR